MQFGAVGIDDVLVFVTHALAIACFCMHFCLVMVISKTMNFMDLNLTQVKQHFSSDDDIFVANNGCLCCTVRSDLTDILSRLHKLQDERVLDALVVETTGLANPAPIMHTFLTDGYAQLFTELNSIVTVSAPFWDG